MTALLCAFAIALGAGPQPGASVPPQRALLLGARVPSSSPQDLQDAAPGIERAFRNALAAHASFSLLTRDEVITRLVAEAKQQLAGCDTESCATQVAELLDVDFIVTPSLGVTGGVWLFDTVLLERRTARTVRRAGTRAGSLSALLASLDPLARQLSGGSSLSSQDPRLQERLGTSAEGVALLRKRLAADPKADISSAWTDIVIERNRESRALPMAVGGSLLAAGVLGAALYPLMAFAGMAVLVLTYLATAMQYGDFDGRWRVPVVSLAVPVLVIVPVAIAGVAAVTTVAALAILDRLDVGRIGVARDGCCRDAQRIAEAERPDLPMRLAPVLAGIGGSIVFGNQLGSTVVMSLLAPLTVLGFTAVYVAFRLGWISPNLLGPAVSVSVPPENLFLLMSLAGAPPLAGFLCAAAPVALLGLVASVVLMANAHDRLTDEVAPPLPAKSPKGTMTTPAGKPAHS